MLNVKIKSIGTYHSDNIVTNEDIIEYFKSKGKDISGFLEGKGRNRRHISNFPNESIITMGISASKEALEKANLKGEEIDLVIFITDTPEFVTPCNASFIHRAIKGKNESSIFDLNCDCVGMISAMEIASRLMTTDTHINKVLLVGSQNLFHHTEEFALKPLLGDSACAVVLEKCNDNKSYIIDSLSFTDTDIYGKVLFQTRGNLMFGNLGGNNTFYHASQDIKELIKRNEINKSDIKKYLISQYSLNEIERIADELEEDISKFTYVGDEYGYTGCTSPFLALNKAIEDREVNKGDLIMMWSIGSGVTSKSVLMRI